MNTYDDFPFLPPEGEGCAPPSELAARRADEAKRARLARQTVGAHARITNHGGIRCLELPGRVADRVVLYFHGGSFRAGRPELKLSFLRRLGDATGVTIIAPFYRLAPDNPFPAGVRDGLRAYRALSADRPTLLAGDSAGGGLAAAVALGAKMAGLPGPAGLLAYSPWLDLACQAKSYRSCAATDILFTPEAARLAASLYLQSADVAHPLASPLLGNAADYPRTLLFASRIEIVRDDSIVLAARLAAAGATPGLIISPAAEHIWPVLRPDSIEGSKAIAQSAAFIRDCLDVRAQ